MGLVSEKLPCLGRWSGHQKNSDIPLAFSYCYCLLTVIPSNILLGKSVLLMIQNCKDEIVMCVLSIFFQEACFSRFL